MPTVGCVAAWLVFSGQSDYCYHSMACRVLTASSKQHKRQHEQLTGASMAIDTTRRLRQATNRQGHSTAPSDGRVVPHRLSENAQSQCMHVPVPFAPASLDAHGGDTVSSQLANTEAPTAAPFSKSRPGTSEYHSVPNDAGWLQSGRAPPQLLPRLVLVLITVPDSQLGREPHKHGLCLHQQRQQPQTRIGN